MTKKKSLIIGLTGGIGSGKTAASDQFEALGITVVDADVIARTITRHPHVLDLLSEHFGKQILLPDGQLDRAALREHIFTRPEEKAWLEAFLHPRIRQEIFDALAQASGPYAILSAPLLLENGLDKYVDRVLVVDVPETTQLARATSRDQCKPALIKDIMSSQLSRQERRAKADDIIDNSADLQFLSDQIKALHQQYMSLSQQNNTP